MSREKDYLTSFTPAQGGENCRFSISTVPHGSGVLVAKTLVELEGDCNSGGSSDPAMNYERRLLLGLSPRSDVPILGSVGIGGQYLEVAGPTETVHYFDVFRSQHKGGTIEVPRQLPDDLLNAFDNAGIYLPGPRDGQTGLYL